MEIKKENKVILQNLAYFNQISISLKKVALYLLKGAPRVDYKNIRLLKKIYVRKWKNSYRQELQMLVKKNKENYLCQLKELVMLSFIII